VLALSAGQTAQDIMDLWKFYREGGKSVEETTRLVRDFLQAIVLTGETTSVTTPLLSSAWSESMGVVRRQIDSTEVSFGALIKATRNAVGGSLKTLEDAKDPWKQAFQDLARWVKDPFRPEKLEDWVQDRIRAMLKKADQAAANGETELARRWRKAARLMKNPVMRALLDIGVGVEEAMTDIARVKAAGRGLRESAFSWFNVFGNDKDGPWTDSEFGDRTKKKNRKNRHRNRATGGPVSAGETYLVGERGPELVTMGGDGHVTPNHALGGSTYNINVHVAPGGDMVEAGRQMVQAIRAYERRSGAVWRS
jgi:hypothetical protein